MNAVACVPTRRFDVDVAARNIASLARRVRTMPPSWRGAGDRVPIVSRDGVPLGHALPGTGIYLNAPALTTLGITRRIPHVFARDELLWALDDRKAWAAITTYASLLTNRTNYADDQGITKNNLAVAGNAWSSLFQAGGRPSAGAYSSGANGATLSQVDTGAWNFAQVAPTGGRTEYLLTFGYGQDQAFVTMMLVDMLWYKGAYSFSTVVDTFTGLPLTRYTSGVGVMATVEVVTSWSPADLVDFVIKYTNQSSVAGHATPMQTTSAAAGVGRLPLGNGPWFPLQTGDYGVKQITGVDLTGTTQANGTYAVLSYKPLMFMPSCQAGMYQERDGYVHVDAMTPLATEAGGALGCLCGFIMAGTITTGTGVGFFRFVQG